MRKIIIGFAFSFFVVGCGQSFEDAQDEVHQLRTTLMDDSAKRDRAVVMRDRAGSEEIKKLWQELIDEIDQHAADMTAAEIVHEEAEKAFAERVKELEKKSR